MDDREILTMAVDLEADYHGLDIPTLIGLIRHLGEVGIEGQLINIVMASILVATEMCKEKRWEGLHLVN